jgi:hypothetical protein
VFPTELVQRPRVLALEAEEFVISRDGSLAGRELPGAIRTLWKDKDERLSLECVQDVASLPDL